MGYSRTLARYMRISGDALARRLAIAWGRATSILVQAYFVTQARACSFLGLFPS
jgi:hypothetical protein